MPKKLFSVIILDITKRQQLGDDSEVGNLKMENEISIVYNLFIGSECFKSADKVVIIIVCLPQMVRQDGAGLFK